MIKQLRIRFIILALLAEVFLLCVIVFTSGFLSYRKMVDTQDGVIDELVQVETYYREFEEISGESSHGTIALAVSQTEDAQTATATEEASAADEEIASTDGQSSQAESAEKVSDEDQTEAPDAAEDFGQPDEYGPFEDPEVPGYEGKPGDGKRYGEGHGGGRWGYEHELWDEFIAYLQEKTEEQEDEPQQAQSAAQQAPSTESTAAEEAVPSPSPTATASPLLMSLEVPLESRYFMVSLTEAGDAVLDMEHIASVTEAEAVTCAEEVQETGRQRGFFGRYRYQLITLGGEKTYLFLDCNREIETYKNGLFTTLLITLGCLLLFALYLVLVSRRVVRPVAESYRKQKEFVSAAGHELRTPLTTISADSEILELEIGENEWLKDIVTQTERMAELTNNLLTLSRMDEGRIHATMLEFPMSDLVEDMVRSFRVLAEKRGLTIETEIAPRCQVTGYEPMVRQLISILMDNAVKYSTGTIAVSLTQRDKKTILTVENSAEPVTEEQLSRFFERFYRAEQSRNSETGGYGLGLAIAKEIVTVHQGSITADSPENGKVRLTVVL